MTPERRQRLLVVATATIAGLYMANLILVEPLYNWGARRAQQIEKLRKQVRSGEQLVGRADRVQEVWDRIRTHSLPANPSQAEQQLLNTLDQWARESGSEILDRVPQWRGDEADHQTLTCRLEINGSLGSLTKFLQRLESGSLDLKVDAMQLTTRDPSAQQMTLGLQLNALVLSSNTP
ncbi:MAG: hypothetical protein RLZ45_91 [Verrucomicrobiota bacterium]